MIVEALRRFFDGHGIAPCRIVAAVSGGADSSALLIALAELRADGFEITAAHVNHHLRGAESDADERFVRDLCQRMAIDLDVADGTLDRAAIKRSGIEAAAREVRTHRLLDIKKQRDAKYVATAHQKNDQAETVLMRLMTGSGLSGLRAIHAIRDDGFIRPLLDVTRAEIDAFLYAHELNPRVDSSNADTRYLRNRIRHTMRAHGLAAIDNLAAVANQAARIWPIVERAIDECEVEQSENETRFGTLPDDPEMRQALLHRHIHRLDAQAREVSARDLERIAAQLDSIQRLTVTKSLELIRRDNALVLRRIPKTVDNYEFEIKAGESIFIPQISAAFEIRSATEQPSNPATQPFQLPKGAPAKFTIRNRRPGDRLRPLNLGGEKKLKDLLIDRKIPVEERDHIPLLIWNGQIVWVAGVTVSDDFKITGGDADRYWAAVHPERSEGSMEAPR